MPTRRSKAILAAALAGLLAACALREGGSRPMMLEGDVVAPPTGWAAFCNRAPDHCAPPAQRPEGLAEALPEGPDALALLVEVNLAVNGAIAPAPDRGRFGFFDRWTLPLTIDNTDLGDCEDYALEKRRMLIELGWPPSALRLAVATSRATGVHAALIAETEEGEWVLDNLIDEVRPWSMTDYVWLKRQASADPSEWRRVRYQ
jgi:predicted transglutaminase-like cysteine proteinase